MLKVTAQTGVCVAAMVVVGCGGGENPLLKKDLAGNAESTEGPP